MTGQRTVDQRTSRPRIAGPWRSGLRTARHWTTRPWAGRALLGTQVLLLAGLLVSVTDGRLWFPAYRVDLSVYRLGSIALLHGRALYGSLPQLANGERLPFTYPPFAAILLSPFALLPDWAAGVGMTAGPP